MVFEYFEYDLTGILECKDIRFTQDHIKSWAHQLLKGVHYMHKNKGTYDDVDGRKWLSCARHAFGRQPPNDVSILVAPSLNTVIHRDLKASNLLINKKGELKIADWGLARSWNSEMKRLTNPVITLWYRPPELLLGYVAYTPKIDMWSVGCIIAEMFRRSGLLKSKTEAEQLELIFRTCGTPTAESWPDLPKKGRLWNKFKPAQGAPRYPRRIREVLKTSLPNPKWMTETALTLIDGLLIMDPDKRLGSEKAVLHEYFFENPIVKPARDLNMKFTVPTMHEWEVKQQINRSASQKPVAMARK